MGELDVYTIVHTFMIIFVHPKCRVLLLLVNNLHSYVLYCAQLAKDVWYITGHFVAEWGNG